jgi:hypothetical protein
MGDMAQAVIPACDSLARRGMPLQRKLCRICGVPLTGRQKLWCSDAHRFEAWNRANPRGGKARQASLPGESRVERAFREWIDSEDGQVVEAEVICRARLLKARGLRRWGIASLWEAIRYDSTLALQGEEGAWRLNNSYRSLLARKVMADQADLAGFFETRELRGRVA